MGHYARILGLCLCAGGFGLLTPAAAQTDRWQQLREDAGIENGVLNIAIGDYIVDNCPKLEARWLPTVRYMMALANRARNMGYSRGEIAAYVEDDAEQARVRGLARRWIAQQGAMAENPASLCQLGRNEISAGSAIGKLLREG